jgi:hypothetical protein
LTFARNGFTVDVTDTDEMAQRVGKFAKRPASG